MFQEEFAEFITLEDFQDAAFKRNLIAQRMLEFGRATLSGLQTTPENNRKSVYVM